MLRKTPKKQLLRFRPLLLSRHPTHSGLRAKNKSLPLFPFRSVVRLGSTTVLDDDSNRVQINTPQAIRNSASKLLMKQKFTEAGVKTANWGTAINARLNKDNIYWVQHEGNEISLNFPIIAKSLFGSRGVGNTKLDTKEELESWMKGKNLNNYIFEEFVKMTREYRLHITQDGCFYTCRKLLKNDAPEGTWQRHDDVCSWALETNPSFKKPANWDAIVQDCITAQKALGLDICAFDVMVQGAKNGKERENTEWNICESCSGPSFGSITLQKYIEEIPKILNKKYNESR